MVNRIYTNDTLSAMEVYSDSKALYVTIKPDDTENSIVHELDVEDIKVLIIDLEEHLVKLQKNQ